MKAVLYSINRPHTDNIKLRGKLRKVLEVRKSKPNIPVPFPAFIYETKKNGGCGKVVGEFICDYIIKAEHGYYVKLKGCKIDAYELLNYADDKPLYGVHISNLKIYDTPKEITSFYKYPTQCDNCYGEIMNERLKKYGRCAECLRLTRPPQSWCYVEVNV